MKIAIVGDSYGSRGDAPYDDPKWEIWGCGNVFTHAKRLTRYFELHTIGLVMADSGALIDRYWTDPTRLGAIEVAKHPSIPDRFARRTGGELAGTGHDVTDTLTPQVINFPFDQLKAWAPKPNGVPYFTSTMAWLVGYALWRFNAELEEISLFGLDMQVGSEYAMQKANFEFWCGVAIGRGVKVTVAPNSPMLQAAFLYAVEAEPNAAMRNVLDKRRSLSAAELAAWNLREEEARATIGEAEARRDELMTAKPKGLWLHYLSGRLAFLQNEIDVATANLKEAETAQGQMKSRMHEMDIIATNYTIADPAPEVEHITVGSMEEAVAHARARRLLPAAPIPTRDLEPDGSWREHVEAPTAAR